MWNLECRKRLHRFLSTNQWRQTWLVEPQRTLPQPIRSTNLGDSPKSLDRNERSGLHEDMSWSIHNLAKRRIGNWLGQAAVDRLLGTVSGGSGRVLLCHRLCLEVRLRPATRHSSLILSMVSLEVSKCQQSACRSQHSGSAARPLQPKNPASRNAYS